MSKISKLGIITSGGDCGGLNAVIYGAVRMADKFSVETCLIPNGYAGLYNLINIDPIVADFAMIDKIHSGVAGSEAGHSRVKISRINDPEKYDRIKAGLKKHQIDGLLIAGGDDTGSVVVDLINQGINCIHIPKTMDLDLQTYSVGGDSTINRIAKFTDELRTTGLTHNRALIIEVFGRYSGHTALLGGIGADADCILIPEIEVDYEVVYHHFKKVYINRLRASATKSSTYTIIAAEGMKDKHGQFFVDNDINQDSFGHKKLKGVGTYIRQQLEYFMKQDPDWKKLLIEEGIYVETLYEFPEIREISLGHLVRAGGTSAYDVVFGKQAGGAAVMLMLNGIMGVTVVRLQSEEIAYIPTERAIKHLGVDMNKVAFNEMLGVCFGREPKEFIPKFEEKNSRFLRYI